MLGAPPGCCGCPGYPAGAPGPGGPPCGGALPLGGLGGIPPWAGGVAPGVEVGGGGTAGDMDREEAEPLGDAGGRPLPLPWLTGGAAAAAVALLSLLLFSTGGVETSPDVEFEEEEGAG